MEQTTVQTNQILSRPLPWVWR